MATDIEIPKHQLEKIYSGIFDTLMSTNDWESSRELTKDSSVSEAVQHLESPKESSPHRGKDYVFTNKSTTLGDCRLEMRIPDLSENNIISGRIIYIPLGLTFQSPYSKIINKSNRTIADKLSEESHYLVGDDPMNDKQNYSILGFKITPDEVNPGVFKKVLLDMNDIVISIEEFNSSVVNKIILDKAEEFARSRTI